MLGRIFVSVRFLISEISQQTLLWGDAVRLTPNPQPGGPGIPFYFLDHHRDATVSITVMIIWLRKPHHYIKVGIPSSANIPSTPPICVVLDSAARDGGTPSPPHSTPLGVRTWNTMRGNRNPRRRTFKLLKQKIYLSYTAVYISYRTVNHYDLHYKAQQVKAVVAVSSDRQALYGHIQLFSVMLRQAPLPSWRLRQFATLNASVTSDSQS